MEYIDDEDYIPFQDNEGENNNGVELSENKDNYEVVNFFKVNKKRIEAYRKKAIKDGGEIVITERKIQGVARLSALHDSYNSIISQTDSRVKGYEWNILMMRIISCFKKAWI